ncbi:MAG TPA: nuclear transport factor 2 family protein [Thermoleophilaceae bacterium]
MKTRACAALLCVLIAGCGGGGSSKPKPISGPAKEAATVIQRLEKATAQRDFATICSDLLAAATRRQAGGEECPEVLGQRARGVRRPRIRIQSIEVQGNQARVRVRTTATGQDAISDVIRLVRENGKFRVLALGR